MWLGSSFTVSESGELATLAEFVWKAASPAKRGKQPIYPDTKATDFNLTRNQPFPHLCTTDHTDKCGKGHCIQARFVDPA